MKKENQRFKSLVFECSVQNQQGETVKFYQTAKNRMQAYEEICRLYPVRAGYCRRFILSEI
mgnify:CR=1 FL=1